MSAISIDPANNPAGTPETSAFLSMIRLDLNHPQIRYDCGPQGLTGMHQRVMSLFPDNQGGRQAIGALHRLTVNEPSKEAILLIQSRVAPNLDRLHIRELAALPATRPLNPLLDRLESGSRWRFEIVANPIVNVIETPGQRAKKIPMRGSNNHKAWLKERIEHHGININADDDGALDLDVGQTGSALGWRGQGVRPAKLLLVTFTGTLTITNPTAARELILTGLGRGKAYGAGLLTLAPHHR